MKKLIRLYPAAWRLRYGLEFEALLEQLPPAPGTILNVILGALHARMTAPPAQPMAASAEGGLMLDFRHRFPNPTPPGLAAALVLLPGALFLVLSLLKYSLGVAGPFDAAAPFYLAGRPVEYLTFLTPFVAFVLAVLPVLGIGFDRSGQSLRGTLVVDARPLNLAVALVSALVAAAFVGYLFLENVLGRIHAT
ncbi:MAG: hypothetical protein H0X16_08285 [Chloroflexi bacterium]|nr:hypothetical protein [Chloroflexota bacterium]